MQDPPYPWTRRSAAGLLVVFAFALALRWGWPGVIDFKLDEASASRLAIAFAHDGWPPLHGVTSSTGVPTPPNAIWVLALPYFLAPDPLLATYWIALLSALSVAVGYWLAHRYFGLYAALVTGVLHAASPFSVYQARKVWTPGVQPLFAVLTVATGALGFIEGRRRWQAVHILLLAFTVGVHFSSLPLALVTAFLMLSNWRRVDWRMVALGVAGAVVMTIPFVIGVIQNPNIVMMQDAAIQDHTLHASAEAFLYTLQNTTGRNLDRWGGLTDLWGDMARWFADIAQTLYVPLILLAIPALVHLAWKTRRAESARSGFIVMVLVWLFSYTIVFTVQWAPIFPHYYIALWPAPYLVVGAGITAVLGGALRERPRWRLLAGIAFTAAVLLIVFVQYHALDTFYTFAAAKFTPGDFGTPLGMKMRAARAALDLLATTDAEEIIVVGEGDRPYQHEGPGAFDVMLHDAPHRFVDGARAAVLPDHPAAVLIQPGQWTAAAWYAATSHEVGLVPLRIGDGMYTLLRTDPARRDAAFADFVPAQPPNLLANGVRIVGYRQTGDGGIQIAWRVERTPPPDGDYHFTVYLFDPEASGSVAQSDGPSHWAAYWRAGDIIINWFPTPALDQEPESLELRAAMYSYPGVVRVPVVDEHGEPVSDSVLLEVIERR